MRQVDEWIGASDDAAIPPRVKLRIFERQGGICPVCTRKLRAGHVEYDHTVALVNGGRNIESNIRAVCDVPCHSDKTRQDVAEKARTYKRRLSAAGIKRRKRSIPGRRFNGEPIPAVWK